MASSSQRLRVLLIAEACNPTWPSVPLVGYNFARALAERGDLAITLATHIKNRPALESDPISRLVDVHYIDNEWLARPLYKLSTALRGGEKLAWTLNTALAWPSYIAYEKQVYRQFGDRLRADEFDLIHRLTPLSPTLPSPLAKWTNVPMLIGPLNGGLPWPKQFPDLVRAEREWLAHLRPAYKSLPYYRSMYRHLAGVIAGSKHTATEIPPTFRGQRFYLPENGVDPAKFTIANQWTPPGDKFRFITIGRMVPYKGLSLTLEAFSQSALLRSAEFHIIGEGPDLPRHEQFIKDNGLESCVRISGWADQAECARQMRESQAFVFPSLREFGGGVVLEAMASGLPCVIVDYGGPAELADGKTGVLLPLAPRAQLVPALRTALEELMRNPQKCRELGEAAIGRVREQHTWDLKAAKLVEFYREVVHLR